MNNNGEITPAKLRAWRRKKGFTQTQAAKYLAVPLGTYANWEQNRRKPRGLALRALQVWT